MQPNVAIYPTTDCATGIKKSGILLDDIYIDGIKLRDFSQTSKKSIKLLTELINDLIKVVKQENQKLVQEENNKVSHEINQASISVTVSTPNIAEKTKNVVDDSLDRSEQLLLEGRAREAVQEILWLLETVVTAFRGVETESGKVEGKYFNKIVQELKKQKQGATLEQVLDWVLKMHGYLSSPQGGGVRHGIDLVEGIVTGKQIGRAHV